MAYTTEALIEAATQVDITTTSDPSTSEVAEWISEVEAAMDAELLGSYTATNEEIDVARVWLPRKDTLEWIKGIVARSIPLDIQGEVVIPEKKPIISMTSLAVNDNTLTEAPSWTTLTEWDGSSADTDYLVIQKLMKTGIMLGIGWYFYGDNKPKQGKKRIKATYTYGYNVPTKILQRYATLKVAIQVLETVMLSGEPTRIASYTGGDFQSFINTQLDPLIEGFRRKIEEIEDRYFPDMPLAIAIMK